MNISLFVCNICGHKILGKLVFTPDGGCEEIIERADPESVNCTAHSHRGGVCLDKRLSQMDGSHGAR